MKRIVSAALVVASCGEPQRPVDRAAELGGENAARVGTEVVPVALVEQVASAQSVNPREALRRLVDDAIAAESAKARALHTVVPASWLLKAARARFTADRLVSEARAMGPPTDAEVEKLTAVHWREIDRPPSVRVQHALVIRPSKKGSPAEASALAHAIHDAVVGAATGKAFRDAATAVPHSKDLEVRVEDLPAFTEEGQIVEQNGAMIGPFARAAYALAKAGDTSGVVETEFGWHVIRLVERLPERRMPLEARRAALHEEVVAVRAREALESRLDELRLAAPVTIAPNAELLMRDVRARTP